MDIEIQLTMDTARLVLFAATKGDLLVWQDLSIDELRQLRGEIDKALLKHEVNRQVRPIRLAGYDVIEAPVSTALADSEA